MILLIVLLFFTTLSDDCTCSDARLRGLSESSQYIMVGRVVGAGDSVGLASGHFVTVVQRVNYKVEEILKGKLEDEEISVGHYIVSGSRIVEKNKTGYHLKSRVFANDQRLLLFLAADPDDGYLEAKSETKFLRLMAANENCVPLATDKVLAKIRRFLTTGTANKKAG